MEQGWGRRPSPGRKSVLADRVVGRDQELGTLRALVAAVKEHRGGAGFLVGEAGIGKSRLAMLVATEAEAAGMSVLRGRAVRTVTPVAYRPLAEALCSAVRIDGGPDTAELGPFRATLGRLIPEWKVESQNNGDHSVLALAEAVLRFLRAVAGGRGCLLVLEDLHWADPETLTIVEYLADNLGSEAVLCLGTLRPEGPSGAHDLARVLEARRVSEVVELLRLHDQDIGEMVRACLGADTIAPEILALAGRAEGVPFLVEELLAVAVTSGSLVREHDSWALSTACEPVVPLTFADSMRRRMATLGHEARAVLVAAAVLGRRFDWDLLPEITGLDERNVLGALHVAVDAQIVSVGPGEQTFRFRHALSRDAVLADLLPPERAALSRRALEAVEAAQPDLAGGWCELAAELAEAAGDRGRAGSLLLRSGERALRHGALVSAEVVLDRARSLLPADDPSVLDVEECLVQVLSLAGKRDRAMAVGRSLLARLGDDPDRAGRRAEVYLRLARAALAATHWEEAHELGEQARAEAAVAADERLAARVDAVGAQTAIVLVPGRAVGLAQAALEAAERLELPEVACEALEILGRSRRPNDLRAAEDAFARALAVAEANSLTVWRARALHELGTIDLLRGAGVTRLEEARELALAQGALATAAVVDVQITASLAFRDDPKPALVAARRGADLARRYGLDQTRAAAVGLEAHVHARAGRRDLVEGCSREAMHASRAPDIEVITSVAAAMLGFVEEDRPSARRHMYGAVAAASQRGLPGGDPSSGPAGGVWALLCQLDGDGTPGGVAGPELLIGNSVHFMGQAYLRYAQAVAAGRAGDTEEAVALVVEGDRVLGDHHWLRQLGRRLVAEAALADNWGDPVAWLREALGFFDQRGEERLASACRSLLRKAGAPVPRRRGEEAAPPALQALGATAREIEVLRLLGDGLSNKEIASRLYLSPRTVERHVANLAGKAGVERRSQLVAFAARAAGDAGDTPPS
ncbi:MAG TPA: AAA family ATPase [Acidimicrobiales bacterium]|nr:AAA family ATPase [Acidimicrobiales bacterium]